jgi:hypothetical protein
LRQDHTGWSYKQLREQLIKDYSGSSFPSLHNLTIPEQDARAPEEDWTAGLPIVRRGIQFQDWNEVVAGIIISLEQTENYEKERGPEGTRDAWHNRNVGIDDALAKGVGKWMPEELIALAERKGKK